MALDRAQAALFEAQMIGRTKGWNRYWVSLLADRHYPGEALRAVTMRESMGLTCGLFHGLAESDILVCGRYGASIRDMTPWDFQKDYDQDSPVSAVQLIVHLPADKTSMLSSARARIDISSSEKDPLHVILGCLDRPRGWPI